jgi:hypothetical protein
MPKVKKPAKAKKSSNRKLSPKDVAELARKYLEPHQPKDFRVVVEDKAELQPDGTWYVFVHPSREGIRMYEYDGRVVEANADLEEAEGLKVLMLDFKSPED